MSDTALQLLSVLIAAVSAAISVVFSVRARHDTKLQHRAQLVALNRQYYSELQRWADAVVDAITGALFLCDPKSTTGETGGPGANVRSAKQTLSALIDRGRFFLPNEAPDKVGQHKPSAYRGFRQPALNHIVNVYEVLEHANTLPNDSSFDQIWDLRKHFVSEIQRILDPDEREEELRTLLASVK